MNTAIREVAVPRSKPAAHDRSAELEDELKQRDDRIRDLRADLDKADALISKMREHVEDCSAQTESWIEAFDMVQDDDGAWKWSDAFVGGQEWFEKYQVLLRKWNQFVPEWNAHVRPRNVGRPLAASEAQVAEVLKLHKAGGSLRGIAEDTSLGLATVRTIVAQRDGTDRTTVKHLQRIDPDRAAAARWRARKRTRDALPKRINETLAKGRELVKEAKGLK
jgi:hypothetical protein